VTPVSCKAELWRWGAPVDRVNLMIDWGNGGLKASTICNVAPRVKVKSDETALIAFVANLLLEYNATFTQVSEQLQFVIEFATESDQALFKLTWM
jgi:hypothetical protein